jgi:hypothetical protein
VRHGGTDYHGEDILSDGGVDDAENQVVLGVPFCALWVDDESVASILHTWLNGDGLAGHRVGPIDKAEETLTLEVRQDPT